MSNLLLKQKRTEKNNEQKVTRNKRKVTSSVSNEQQSKSLGLENFKEKFVMKSFRTTANLFEILLTLQDTYFFNIIEQLFLFLIHLWRAAFVNIKDWWSSFLTTFCETFKIKTENYWDTSNSSRVLMLNFVMFELY